LNKDGCRRQYGRIRLNGEEDDEEEVRGAGSGILMLVRGVKIELVKISTDDNIELKTYIIKRKEVQQDVEERDRK
jgi:hypothetical protein